MVTNNRISGNWADVVLVYHIYTTVVSIYWRAQILHKVIDIELYYDFVLFLQQILHTWQRGQDKQFKYSMHFLCILVCNRLQDHREIGTGGLVCDIMSGPIDKIYSYICSFNIYVYVKPLYNMCVWVIVAFSHYTSTINQNVTNLLMLHKYCIIKA